MNLRMIKAEPAFCVALAAAEHEAIGSAVTKLVDRISVALADWQVRAHARRELARLDERTLHDIGLSRMDAEFEARKPFWRA